MGLTRELLRHRLHQGVVRPSWVPAEARWTERLEAVLAVFRGARGWTLEELREQLSPRLDGDRQARFYRGVYALLEERLTFAQTPGGDQATRRREAFARSAALLTRDGDLGLGEFLALLEADPACGPAPLYGDLPHLRRIAAFDDLQAGDLRRRYNSGLLRGLLRGARRLTVRPGREPGVAAACLLRNLGRLGLQFRPLEDGDGPLVEVDGPLLAAAQERRYAERAALLAELLPRWGNFGLSAALRLPSGGNGRLVFPDGEGVPPELAPAAPPEEDAAIGGELLGLLGPGWEPVAPAVPDLPFAEWSVPDYSWLAPGGGRRHLEIFRPAQGRLFALRSRRCGAKAPADSVWCVERSLPGAKKAGPPERVLPYAGRVPLERAARALLAASVP